jgi:iron(III) transport system permease protein
MPRTFSLAVFVVMAAFFAFFFVVPIWTTVNVAFHSSSGGFTMDYIWEVFRNPLFLEGLWNSLVIAVFTTLGCLILSVPLALIFTRYAFPGKTVLNSLVLTPMILPPFVGAIGIRAMLGQAGAVNSLLMKLGLMDAQHPADWLGQGQMLGIVIMNVLHLYPILYLNVAAALANLDPALEDAAANLGCGSAQRFWKITLPLIMPGIFAGGTIVFIWAFTELGVPLVFDFDRVTSVQIFNAIKDISGNPFPYALVVVVLVSTALLYFTSKLILERNQFGGGGRATTARETRWLPVVPRWACTILFVLCIAVAVVPHVGVVLLSFTTEWYGTILPGGFTLDHYHAALGHELTLSSISNSLKYASLATVLDLLLGVSVAYVNARTRMAGRRLLDGMAMLPLAVPGIVIAFGYLAMTREGQPFHFLMLGEDPVLLLIIAYSVRRLPFVVRSATAGFQQVSPALEEAAQNLGCSPLKTLLKITMPLIAPNLVAGGLLAFAFSMLEVSDSLILAQQAAHYPITKAIYSLVGSLGDGPYLASALGVWAMVFLAVTLVGAGLLLGKKLGMLFRA